MGDDDAWDRGSVIRPNEYGRWASGISTIVNRHTQETDADRLMRVMTCVKETNVGSTERAIGKQKLAIVGGAIDPLSACANDRWRMVVFCQSTEQDGSGASMMWMVSDAGSVQGSHRQPDGDGVGAWY
ncbi:hypothetical protein MHU86_12063 [Fragilaria crotonensis]|nr:hypothetical protein MHU86_12063 [Fragilaria crotonensis]